MRAIGVFCGSSFGANTAYTAAARELGELLAGNGIKLIYGGARIGLMGVVADAAMAAGGCVEGVILEPFADSDIWHRGLSELHMVENMSRRKERMIMLSDAFIALPGGLGTLDELFEVWTLTQIGLQTKHSVLLNTDGYYDPLLQFIDLAQAQGFLNPEHRAALSVVGTPSAALACALEMS